MDDASSVVSSTFSLGEPVATHNDSDDEDSVSNVAAGVEKATLGDAASNTASSHATPNASVPASEAETSEHSTVNLNRCLFCNYDSPTVPLNVLHMERIHGMFIPEQKYLVDLEGLIGSLRERIYEYHECLYCAKLKPTVFGLQTHMRDKGHCKIAFDTEDQQLEIGEFYDFRSTYSDGGNDSEDEDDAGVKLGMKRPTKIINEDGDDEEVEEGDGWETDSSASSLDSEDLTAVPLDQRTHQYEKLHKHPHHSRDDPRPHHNADGWHSHAHKHANAVFYSDYELHLPSGRAVGHRSLAKYYRQNLVNHPSPSERQEQEQLRIQAREGRTDSDDEEDQQVSRRERGRAVASRANGGTGMIGVSETKKKEVRAEEKRSRKVAERAQRRQEWGNNKQSNSQKHFRVSNYASVIGTLLTSPGSFASVIAYLCGFCVRHSAALQALVDANDVSFGKGGAMHCTYMNS